MVLILLLAVPALALAANVSANCTSSGGSFSTYGTANGWQHHYHGQSFWQTTYEGRQYRSHTWGWAIGWQGGEVYGSSLSSPGARCLI